MSLAVFDIFSIIIFAIFIFLGFKNGMIKSFLLFLNSIISWIISVYLSKFMAYSIYNRFFEPDIIKNVKLLSVGKNFNSKILFDTLPSIFTKYLYGKGITTSKITHIISSVSKEVLPEKISQILMPTITDVIKYFGSGIIFIIILFLGRLAVKFILKSFKCKAINYSDKILGGFLGFLKGYVAILLIACVLKAFLPFFSGDNKNIEFIASNVNSSVIFKQIYNKNPMYNLLVKS